MKIWPNSFLLLLRDRDWPWLTLVLCSYALGRSIPAHGKKQMWKISDQFCPCESLCSLLDSASANLKVSKADRVFLSQNLERPPERSFLADSLVDDFLVLGLENGLR